MFIHKSALLLPAVALSSLIAAAPGPVTSGETEDYCPTNNSSPVCCAQIYENNPTNVNYLEGLLGVVLNIDVGGLLGLECSPISMSGGQDCKGTELCCWVGNFNGPVSLGCMNINL